MGIVHVYVKNQYISYDTSNNGWYIQLYFSKLYLYVCIYVYIAVS